MVGATQFLAYAVGLSVLVVAVALAIRLLRVPSAKPQPHPLPTAEESAGLAARLQEFQAARFASPIVRRQLNPEDGPRPPRAPHVYGPVRGKK